MTRASDPPAEIKVIQYVTNSVISMVELRHHCMGKEAKEAMRQILKKWKEDRNDFDAFDEIVNKFEAEDLRRVTFEQLKHDLKKLDEACESCPNPET